MLFYRIELYAKTDVIIFIPKGRPVGIRKLVEPEDIEDFYQRLRFPGTAILPPKGKTHWHKEYRAKKESITRGTFFDRTLVYIKLRYKSRPTPVDQGMLREVEDLIIREISLSISKMPRDVKCELDGIVATYISQQQECAA
jgi:RNA polymerase-interacting CarD/CdnL/TRCF family regulator